MSIGSFNLKHTFESGQPLAFYGDYYEVANRLEYSAGSFPVSLSVRKQRTSLAVDIESPGTKAARKEVIRRFRLNDDIDRVYDNIGTDKFMHAAISSYRGLRLTLNDPWETTLCFIISQYNNVKRIRKIVKSILSRFGNPIFDPDGRAVGTRFPTSAELARVPLNELVSCGAGFRSRYLKDAAEFCTYNMDLYKINTTYPKLKARLMEMNGVGEKVADCIALMGYGKLESFPVDVWVKRTMEKVYFKGKSINNGEIREFASDLWGDYAGYAQQYLFWHGRQKVV